MTSVHLQSFPVLNNIIVDNDIVKSMDIIRSICNCVFSLRKEENIRVRMPLAKITICGDCKLDENYIELLKQEVNTREVEFLTGNLNEIATQEIVLNMKECGKKYGSKLKDILLAQKNGEWQVIDGKLKIADVELENELYNVVYKSKEDAKAVYCEEYNLLVTIDTKQTEDLIIEGLSRDVVRIIQQSRKDNKFDISDRINIEFFADDDIFLNMFNIWKNYICEQTLANDIKQRKLNEVSGDIKINEIDGYKFAVSLLKI